jgi:hypothetical protein
MYHQPPEAGRTTQAEKWQRHDRFARWGLWRAEVLNTEDPEHRGRVQVRVLHLHPPGLQPAAAESSDGTAQSDILVQANTTGATPFEGVPPDACPWAEPCFAFGGKKGFNSGAIMVPYVGSTVWVAFEMGFSGRPVWFGSWLGKDEIPEEIAEATNMADIRLIRTEFGHLLKMDDTDSTETCFLGIAPLTGDKIRFLEFDEPNTEVRLFNDPANDPAAAGSGTRIYMTEDEMIISKGDPANAQVITIDANKIEVKSGTSIVTINKNGDIAIAAAGKVTTNSTAATEMTAGTGLTITVTGNASINATGNAEVIATGAATIGGVTGTNLGAAGGQGVCLDSLIAVIATAYGIYNTHTHPTAALGPPSPPSATMVPPAVGVNSSVLVKSAF